MLITIDHVLTADELAKARDLITRSSWQSGLITAGPLAAQVKNNQQLAEDAEHLPALRALVLAALERSALFFTAALRRRICRPSSTAMPKRRTATVSTPTHRARTAGRGRTRRRFGDALPLRSGLLRGRCADHRRPAVTASNSPPVRSSSIRPRPSMPSAR